MADPERRNIDWATAETQDATLSVELTGASSKVFKQRFERVLAQPNARSGRRRSAKR
jgi:hypothetical protein